MSTSTRDLSTFETALLAELKDVVADRAYTKSKRYRLVACAAAVGLAVAIGALPGFDVATPTAAYAVSTDTAGDVVVRIHDPNDLHGLSEALAAESVTAEVERFDLAPHHDLVLGSDGASQVPLAHDEPQYQRGVGLIFDDRSACDVNPHWSTPSDLPIWVTPIEDGHRLTIHADVVAETRTLRIVVVREQGQPVDLFATFTVPGVGYCGVATPLNP